MKVFGASVLLLTAVALSSAYVVPADTPTEWEHLEESTGSRTWNAIKDWMSPVTNYMRDSLPDKTPSQFADDVRDVAVDLHNRAREHPVVQGVSSVVRPVGQWISDTATELSRTPFRDMYNSAVNTVQRMDEHVGGWINDRTSERLELPPPQSQDVEVLLQ